MEKGSKRKLTKFTSRSSAPMRQMLLLALDSNCYDCLEQPIMYGSRLSCLTQCFQ